MKYACLLALALACGGAEEDPYEAYETPTECVLQPGDYSVEYSNVSNTCTDDPTPTELFTVGPGGTVAGSSEPPDGCEDYGFVKDGCAVAFSRQCFIPTSSGDLEADIDFSYNFKTGRGSSTGTLLLTSGGVALDGCSWTQRAEITKLR